MENVARVPCHLTGQRALVVASTGGHLTQAVRWHERLGFSDDSTFVTFDSPQSRSLLRARPHRFIPYVRPRDYRGILQASRALSRIARDERVDLIFSTGAGVALACLRPAWALRLPLHYFESVSRFEGPSMTGRLLRLAPSVRRGTEHLHWSSAAWPFVGSLLDDYTYRRPAAAAAAVKNRRIFVSLGTIAPYRFDRLVENVLPLLRPTDEVTWQLGATIRDDLPGSIHRLMSSAMFEDAARKADVVITQSGVGAILDLLGMGDQSEQRYRGARRTVSMWMITRFRSQRRCINLVLLLQSTLVSRPVATSMLRAVPWLGNVTRKLPACRLQFEVSQTHRGFGPQRRLGYSPRRHAATRVVRNRGRILANRPDGGYMTAAACCTATVESTPGMRLAAPSGLSPTSRAFGGSCD